VARNLGVPPERLWYYDRGGGGWPPGGLWCLMSKHDQRRVAGVAQCYRGNILSYGRMADGDPLIPPSPGLTNQQAIRLATDLARRLWLADAGGHTASIPIKAEAYGAGEMTVSLRFGSGDPDRPLKADITFDRVRGTCERIEAVTATQPEWSD
jgi:hypothetical protein